MKSYIKRLLQKKEKNSPMLAMFISNLRKIKTLLCGGGIKIVNHGVGKFKKDIIGRGNVLVIGKGTSIQESNIRIRGNNNRIIIGENCRIRKNCSFWITGDNSAIILGNNVTMQHANHFNTNEGRVITIGDDCMLANNIIIRTSDDHGIFDMKTKVRLNAAKDVAIGKHVWIAPNSRIMKGVIVGEGSVIGSNAIVTRDIPSNALAVGIPAKVVKENIIWSHSIYEI